MPDRADPQPRPAAPAAAAGSKFKPVALPALKGVLHTRDACETKHKAKPPMPEDLDRFGRSYTA
ncbi:hypothetical protein [Salinarimonas ramus]|uniref:Uncharacterized protein n=1 Tax=Salinarimonas ramus TaxID=690164 RepID=A0A917V5M8_9HYPH|nr:hypothetical protein [Salinarimonas ramus]GGK40165.1 hypothetical protein GCM10011322_29170 [Salinarimonas ramus]